jgi:hypothetical protein
MKELGLRKSWKRWELKHTGEGSPKPHVPRPDAYELTKILVMKQIAKVRIMTQVLGGAVFGNRHCSQIGSDKSSPMEIELKKTISSIDSRGC